MEDSGIDSSDNHVKPQFVDDSSTSSNDTDDVIYRGSTSKTTDGTPGDAISNIKDRTSTCRALQKKLELKVERAKRNYQQMQQLDGGEGWDVCISQPKATNIIPINRLQYPGKPEQHTLIEYREVRTNEDDDDLDQVDDDLGAEEAKFFASKHKKTAKQDLSDTFSIQEMTIDSGSESGSDTLELLPPPTDAQYWERLAAALPCCGGRDY